MPNGQQKKAANLFQIYCFRWPPVTAGIQFWKFELGWLMNNSINLRPLFFLKWSNKQHHHYNDIYPIKNICNCIAPRKTCLWVIQGNKDKNNRNYQHNGRNNSWILLGHIFFLLNWFSCNSFSRQIGLCCYSVSMLNWSEYWLMTCSKKAISLAAVISIYISVP